MTIQPSSADIVERLLSRARLDEYANSAYDKEHYPLLREAANEILRCRGVAQAAPDLHTAFNLGFKAAGGACYLPPSAEALFQSWSRDGLPVTQGREREEEIPAAHPTQGGDKGEPVAWRWRHVNSDSKEWNYQNQPIRSHNEYLVVEALYAEQPHASAPLPTYNQAEAHPVTVDTLAKFIHEDQPIMLNGRSQPLSVYKEFARLILSEFNLQRKPPLDAVQRSQEPVSYRWRQPGNKHWIYDPTPEWIEDHKHEIELEPLYASPQPASNAGTLWGQIAAVYGQLDAEDCARIDREWAKQRGYILPVGGSSALAYTSWQPADTNPPVNIGQMKEFVVAVYRSRTGKVYTFGCNYLNAYQILYEGCPKDETKQGLCDGCADDGCPTSGWFYLVGDGDNESGCYQSLDIRYGDKLVGWQEMPRWAGAVSSTHQSAPGFLPSHTSGERLPSGDAAVPGADTAMSSPRPPMTRTFYQSHECEGFRAKVTIEWSMPDAIEITTLASEGKNP